MRDKKVLCISGRKQAGKDTCYRFLRNLCEDEHGWRAAKWEGKVPAIRQFYFADALKRMCIDILGCPEDKVYGTDADKNTLVPHLLWENFPIPVFDMSDGTVRVGGIEKRRFDEGWWGWDEWVYGMCALVPTPDLVAGTPRTGPMTVREILQYWGTEVFRKQYQDVWADACLRAIEKSDCDLAVITDCRFPNEVAAARKAGGRVIRLTRTPFSEDAHASETALDRDRFDWSGFDDIIDNRSLSVEQQCFQLHVILYNLGWVPRMSMTDFRSYLEGIAS